MLEQLLTQYQDVLAPKHIQTKRDLSSIIHLDLGKIVWALATMRKQSPKQLLQDFFSEDTTTVSYLFPKIQGQSLYHIGFEVYEPLDLVVEGFEHWIAQQNRIHAQQAKIHRVIRFPASESLQKRVHAFVEIMRIWVMVTDQLMMLELFDIQRPIQHLPKWTTDNRNRCAMLHDPTIFDQPYEIFAHDTIWHYALYLEQAQQVLELHHYFQSLGQSDQRYVIPFADIINNKHDGSFYTKIINRQQGVELEFVTEGQF